MYPGTRTCRSIQYLISRAVGGGRRRAGSSAVVPVRFASSRVRVTKQRRLSILPRSHQAAAAAQDIGLRSRAGETEPGRGITEDNGPLAVTARAVGLWTSQARVASWPHVGIPGSCITRSLSCCSSPGQKVVLHPSPPSRSPSPLLPLPPFALPLPFPSPSTSSPP